MMNYTVHKQLHASQSSAYILRTLKKRREDETAREPGTDDESHITFFFSQWKNKWKCLLLSEGCLLSSCISPFR